MIESVVSMLPDRINMKDEGVTNNGPQRLLHSMTKGTKWKGPANYGPGTAATPKGISWGFGLN
jgi:hypothetical protein